MELKPVYKTIIFPERPLINNKLTFFSFEETKKKYMNQMVTVDGKSYPLRLMMFQEKAENESLCYYSNMDVMLLFYYIDPTDSQKIRVVKKVPIETVGQLRIYRTI